MKGGKAMQFWEQIKIQSSPRTALKFTELDECSSKCFFRVPYEWAKPCSLDKLNNIGLSKYSIVFLQVMVWRSKARLLAIVAPGTLFVHIWLRAPPEFQIFHLPANAEMFSGFQDFKSMTLNLRTEKWKLITEKHTETHTFSIWNLDTFSTGKKSAGTNIYCL